MRNRWIKGVALTLAVASAGCAGAFQRPEVELEGIRLGSIGLQGGTLNVNVLVRNPNGFGFQADRLDYQLFLRRPDAAPGDSAWTELAEGTYDEKIEIGARSTERVTIPVSFSFSDLAEARRSLLRSGSVQYRAVGTVDARTSFGHRRVPFRKTGTFTMSGLGR